MVGVWLAVPLKIILGFLQYRVRYTSYLFFRPIDLRSGQHLSEMLAMKLKPTIVFGSVCTTPIIVPSSSSLSSDGFC